MPVAAINGAEIFSEDVGAGPPMVFRHGTLTGSGSWAAYAAREVVALLNERSRPLRGPLAT